MCERFGVARQRDWPVAPLCLLADGGMPGSAWWLRADPAHLQATRADLTLARSGDLGLTPPDCAALAETINRHFAGDNLELVAACTDRWYLRAAQPQDLVTTPPEQAAGRSIDALLPRGGQALAWHRRLNEIQMLLHEHPVNLAREARGELPVNSVWLWGGGVRPACAALAGHSVWTDAPLAHGLALCAGTPCSRLPAGAAEWLEQAGHGHHFLALESELDAASLEQRWIAPLLAAVRAGRLDRCALVGCHRTELLRFTLSRRDLWKFWRIAPALADEGRPHA